jgi:RNA polymerase sigma factor (sigma-70 family)
MLDHHTTRIMPNRNVQERQAGGLLASVAEALRRTYPGHPHVELEEAAAEALCRYYETTRDPARSPASPEAWIFTVAVNVLRAEHRRTQRLVFRAAGEDGEAPVVDTLAGGDRSDAAAATHHVRMLLERLSPAVAEAIWLHDVEGWKPSEIAATLGCSTNAVNLRIKRGHRRLLDFLRKENDTR